MPDDDPYRAPAYRPTERSLRRRLDAGRWIRPAFWFGLPFGISLAVGAILGGFSGGLSASIGNFYARKLRDREPFDESAAMFEGAVEGLLYGAAIGVMLGALSMIIYLVRRRLKNAGDSADSSR